MSKPASQLNTPKARFKGAVTSLKNLKEQISDEEYQAALRTLLDLPDEAGSEVVYASDAEAIQILAEGKEEQRDYDALLTTLETQMEHTRDFWNRATSDADRSAYGRRLRSLEYMHKITRAASTVKAEPRTFGCRYSPTMKISGRQTGFPDIPFHHHTFTTEDPLLIARILDYMENKEPSDPVVENLPPGYVALVEDRGGTFAQWIDGKQAEDVIATSRGMFRRPYR